MKNKNINENKIQLLLSLIESAKKCGRTNFHYENQLSDDEKTFLIMNSKIAVSTIETVKDFDGYPLYILSW